MIEKWLATVGPVRARPEVQVRYKIHLTGRDYVTQQAWEEAILFVCPLHPNGGCGFRRHGTYSRVEPPGTRIARYYCSRGQVTFSLLPDCLASRWSSTLDEVEEVVVLAAKEKSQEAAAAKLHPTIQPSGALRWLRRRIKATRTILLTIASLLPGSLGNDLNLVEVRKHLGTQRALSAMREVAAKHFHAMPPPLGFHPRPMASVGKRKSLQHETGPDPPTPG